MIVGRIINSMKNIKWGNCKDAICKFVKLMALSSIIFSLFYLIKLSIKSKDDIVDIVEIVDIVDIVDERLYIEKYLDEHVNSDGGESHTSWVDDSEYYKSVTFDTI
jgi:hypothetical protein